MHDIVKILLWIVGILPGIIYLFIKISAKKYFQRLQQKIQADASQIDNFLEQRVIILLTVAGFPGLLLYILPFLFADLPNIGITSLRAGICATIGIGGVVLIVVKLNKIIRSIDKHIKTLKENHAEKITEAWE